MLTLIKAHALGNDFLLLDATTLPADADRPALARRACARHRGVGADGLIFFETNNFPKLGTGPDLGAKPGQAGTGPDLGGKPGQPGTGPLRVSMALLNADGSYSEVSGNGVRCLAAWIAERAGAPVGARIQVDTDAGAKHLELLARGGRELTFRAAMGHPEDVAPATLDVNGRPVDVVTLRVGNPQCVVLGELSEARLHDIASRLAVHPSFPQGTNVELATVEAAGIVRILIWERGVGPTEASGTGACAAAVAAMVHGGAAREVDVISPGGTQRVEWRNDGLYLTGPAEIIGSIQMHA